MSFFEKSSKPNRCNEISGFNTLPSKQEFLEQVKKDVIPQLIKYESVRKLVNIYSTYLPIIISVVLLIVLVYFKHPSSYLVEVWLILSGIVIFIGHKVGESFKNNMQTTVFPQLLKYLRISNLSHHQKNINLEIIKESLALDIDFNHECYLETTNKMSGTFANTYCSILECSLSQDSHTLSAYSTIVLEHFSGNFFGNNSKETLFKGIIIDIPLTKYLSGQTLLLNKQQSRYGIEEIVLKNIASIEKYCVLSTDTTETEILITQSFMDKLAQLKTSFHSSKIEVSFFADYALFFIHTDKEFLESFSLLYSVTDTDIYESFYDQIKSLEEMIELLKTNCDKITSKPESIKNHKTFYSQFTKANTTSWLSIIIKFLFIMLLFILSLYIIWYISDHLYDIKQFLNRWT